MFQAKEQEAVVFFKWCPPVAGPYGGKQTVFPAEILLPVARGNKNIDQ